MWGTLLLNLAVTFSGTLTGVLFAFGLDRLWEKKRTRKSYALQLSACRHDLANLLTTCEIVQKQLKQKATPLLELDIPAVRALLQNPTFHEYGPLGLTIVLTMIPNLVTAVRNAIERMPDDIVARIETLMRGIRKAEQAIDAELKHLGFGFIMQPEDKALLEEFKTALRG